jgi:hypothetical protein
MIFKKQIGHCMYCNEDVVLYNKPTRHLKFLVISLITSFLVSPIWIYFAIYNKVNKRCPECNRIVRRKYYKDIIESEEIPGTFKELNGFLYIIFVFISVIYPMYYAIVFIFTTYIVISSHSVSLIAIVIGISIITIITISIVSGVLLVKRNSISLMLYKILFAFLMLFSLFYVILSQYIKNDEYYLSSLFSAILILILSVICFIYFKVSKRVKVYFNNYK